MSNGLIPGTGFRTRSPLTNARDVSRKFDGTSISAKTLSDLRGVAVAKATGPVQNGRVELEDKIVGVAYILAYTTATGALLGVLREGVDYTVVLENANGKGEVVENNVGDQSAETWLIHYSPDAEDVDIPQNEASTVTP